jgi:hypothetical protein
VVEHIGLFKAGVNLSRNRTSMIALGDKGRFMYLGAASNLSGRVTLIRCILE